MEQPDSPGIWVSDKGHVAQVYRFREDEHDIYADVYHTGLDVGAVRPLADLTKYGSDWQKREVEPYKDDRPPKPGLVLVTYVNDAGLGPFWVGEDASRGWGVALPYGGCYKLKNLRVAPHPDNDPALVELIENAQK